MGVRGKDEVDLECVEALLTAAGLRAQRVPPVEAPRCDLAAEDDTERYLIEVKGIHDEEAVAATLRTGEIYDKDRDISRSGSVSDKIEEALHQLRETDNGSHSGLWLVVLIERGPSWSGVIMKQVLSTLYGVRTIADLGPQPGVTRKCLYFSHSAFFRHRGELDGAIIMDGTGARLCLNDYSERAHRLHDSRLGCFFVHDQSLYDAARLESEGGYLVADCDTDRNDQQAVLQYLREKYHLKRLTVMHSYGWLGAFRIVQ